VTENNLISRSRLDQGNDQICCPTKGRQTPGPEVITVCLQLCIIII